VTPRLNALPAAAMATAPINPQSQRNPDCLRQTPEIRAIEGRERIIRNHVCVVVL